MIHTVKGFSVVNEAEVDIFLEFPCFFCDPTNVGYLVSGSSAFSKSSLSIWKFSVHEFLKPSLENFEHYFASEWSGTVYNGILLSRKKNEILLFATTWMDLEGTVLSEVSKREKDKYCSRSLICRS